MSEFQSPQPYPQVQVCCKNSAYAKEMLRNIGSCHSEMSTVTLYNYNSIILEEAFGEVSRCFQGISIVEMHHLKIFSKLAMLLGAQPRLWAISRGKQLYWSPACNKYQSQLKPILVNAIEGENAAIAQYKKQSEFIRDESICEILNRIILDEERHIEILKDLFEKYVQHTL